MADITILIRKEEIDRLPLREATKKHIRSVFNAYYGLSLHGRGYIFIPSLVQDFKEPNMFIDQLELTILHELAHIELLGFDGDAEEAIFNMEDIIRDRMANQINIIEVK